MCICVWLFPGPAVPPGYRPRLPDRGEGRVGEPAQRWRRRQLLWFRVPIAASFWSGDCVPRAAGSDRPGLSTDAGKASRTSETMMYLIWYAYDAISVPQKTRQNTRPVMSKNLPQVFCCRNERDTGQKERQKGTKHMTQEATKWHKMSKLRELKLISQCLSVPLSRAPSQTEKNVREASSIIDVL